MLVSAVHESVPERWLAILDSYTRVLPAQAKMTVVVPRRKLLVLLALAAFLAPLALLSSYNWLQSLKETTNGKLFITPYLIGICTTSLGPI